MLSNFSMMCDMKYYDIFLLRKGKRMDVSRSDNFFFNLDTVNLGGEKKYINVKVSY